MRLPNSAFSPCSLLSRSEKAPERGYLLLLLSARWNLFSLTVSVSCWKLLYLRLGAESIVILSVVDGIPVFPPLAAPVVTISVLQQQFSALCHNALACHTWPEGVLKEVLLLAFTFLSLLDQKDWQLLLYYGRRSLLITYIPRCLDPGRKRWSHEGGREGIAHDFPLVCVWLPQTWRNVDLEHRFPHPGLCLAHSLKITKVVSLAAWRPW